jgi:hypothetical protein
MLPEYIPSFELPLASFAPVPIKVSVFRKIKKPAEETATSSVALKDTEIVPPGSTEGEKVPDPDTTVGLSVSV